MRSKSTGTSPLCAHHAGWLLAGILLLAGSGGASADETSQPSRKDAATSVDFAHEVVPLLQKRCAKCHAGTQRKGGFSINTRQSLLSGGENGPAAVSRQSADSALIERLTSDDPGMRMPPEGERLSGEQIALLRRWIDRGLPWEDGFAFGKISRQAPLAPRRPLVPEGPAVAALSNPIDRFLIASASARKLEYGRPVSDAVFARRASFDLSGLPPTPADLDALVEDRRPDKRERFVDQLLDDRAAYAAHWLTFWNDLLRNAYHGTGFIDGGRRQITAWLYGALYENKPYDRFVRELVSPVPGSGSEGFTFGIKWRGTVNESQRREIQAAQSVAQVFLGTNLKCASCHDSFVNHWKLVDAYALASVFAEGPLELHRCDQPTGVASIVGFLYPQLGSINAKTPQTERVRQLADLLTHSGNGRLARTIVNRLWAKLFGRGLVEPLDNMDAEPWNQDLLDFLATDLADHGYDLKRTLRLMATSQAYQLPGVGHAGATEPTDAFVFRGPLIKRTSAEEFVDAVFSLTRAWPSCDATLLKRDGRGQGGQLGDIARALADLDRAEAAPDQVPLSGASWIWIGNDSDPELEPKTIYLRRAWHLDDRPIRATATFAAVDTFELIVNGKVIAKSGNWRRPVQVDVAAALQPGVNVVALKVISAGDQPNSSGAIGEIHTLGANGRRSAVLVSDPSWQASGTADSDWLKPDFKAEAWTSAVELGAASAGPWKLAQLIAAGAAGVQRHAPLPDGFQIRASLLALDPLQTALGRPNREQIVSARDAVPTLLQALQLTNGPILGRYLSQGAVVWLAAAGAEPLRLIDEVYRAALGRLPSDDERRLAMELIGGTPDVDGIEDLLWSVCMLPEFQLVP